MVRNNFLVKDIRHRINERFHVDSIGSAGLPQTASWEDVKNLYELDRKVCHRLLPKVTEQHIKPTKQKMVVSVATQVFSQRFGKVMLSTRVVWNCTNIAVFNDLFDSVNGSGAMQDGELKGSINANSIHFVYWKYALAMLSHMNFIDKSSGEINTRSSVLRRIESTIEGYKEVVQICLNEDMKNVSLRYLVRSDYTLNNSVCRKCRVYYYLLSQFLYTHGLLPFL